MTKPLQDQITLVTGGKMRLDNLVTHRFNFDEYLKAYHDSTEERSLLASSRAGMVQ